MRWGGGGAYVCGLGTVELALLPPTHVASRAAWAWLSFHHSLPIPAASCVAWAQCGLHFSHQRTHNHTTQAQWSFCITPSNTRIILRGLGAVKPPPEPTEEAMADLEALIKRRIADHHFDDVVRVLPPPPERKRREVELDDNKASKVGGCARVRAGVQMCF